ncbi:MAG: class I SAM-dependent methyltransferase [Actinomycetota bacterium]|nr:class I SAM-dependent methyltransferase [Actinomycetota bacterium]
MGDLRPATTTWPGDELVSRVTGATDRDWFYESGRQSVREIAAVLSLAGRSLESFSSILDFGSGCGRILLWLEDVAKGAAVHGVDIDRQAVAWADQHLPFATVSANQPAPPLAHPDGYFDLVYSHSVFTHIDERLQDQWLRELRRVTRPGGLLVLSIHGEHAFAEFEAGALDAGGDPSSLRERLVRDGIVFHRDDIWVDGPFPDFYHTTFHAPWYVFGHWGRYFTVRALVSRGSLGYQDFVLLERTPELPRQVSLSPVAGASRRARPPDPDGSVWSALERAMSLVEGGPDLQSPASHGRLSVAFRRSILRVLRHYSEHDQRVHEAMLDVVRHLATHPDDPTRSGSGP